MILLQEAGLSYQCPGTAASKRDYPFHECGPQGASPAQTTTLPCLVLLPTLPQRLALINVRLASNLPRYEHQLSGNRFRALMSARSSCLCTCIMML